ncbi:MAG: hypothetical protein HDS70_03020 [Bacteroidales bacterium]|nr:hypothetical protein [Bacteroidales bacterium]MBD5221323.1 hypothetical protein [Bacteroidales bacterium]
MHKRFFALRNGVLADAVKKAGCPCPRVYGLNVPQIASIAREIGTDDVLARKLWTEKECRESRLLACYLFDADAMTHEEALRLAADVQSVEEADMLAFRLLKRMSHPERIAEALEDSNNESSGSFGSYTARVLKRHLEN